jgi:hypothetical protein
MWLDGVSHIPVFLRWAATLCILAGKELSVWKTSDFPIQEQNPRTREES